MKSKEEEKGDFLFSQESIKQMEETKKQEDLEEKSRLIQM